MPSPQAKVFELEYTDGRPTGKVLKVAHTGGQGLNFISYVFCWFLSVGASKAC